MKIYFDCRFIRVDHHDGISRFSASLFTALSKITDLTAIICDSRQLNSLPGNTNYLLANNPTNPFSELVLPAKLNKAGATHVFSPMQTMGTFSRRYKLILTLHDLIYYSHPKAPPFLSLGVRIAWRLYHLSYLGARALLNRADMVATVSNTSKNQIEAKKLTTKPVTVIYNAPDSKFQSYSGARKLELKERRRLLYMGSFMPYKNVETLVRALKHLPEFELVLMSKISQKRQAGLTAIAGEAANRLIFLNGVSDKQYALELQEGFALVSASKDEGFGIPLVEAMECGLPIVVSDIPIFREIAGDCALYFDFDSPTAFVDRVHDLRNQSTWTSMSESAKRRAGLFDWDASALKLLEALRNL